MSASDAPKGGGFTPEEQQLLGRASLHNPTDLWAAIGKDFDHGLEALESVSTLSAKRLMVGLAAEALAEKREGSAMWRDELWKRRPSRLRRASRLGRYLPSMALVAVAVTLLLALGATLLTVLQPLPQVLEPLARSRPLATTASVPAFTPIRAEMLGEQPLLFAPPETVSSLEDITGHVALEPLPAGTLIRADQLSDCRPTAEGPWYQLTVPISGSLASIERGACVRLLPLGRLLPATPNTLEQVIVMGKGEGTLDIVLALPEGDVEALQRSLAASKLVVLTPLN